MNALKTLFISTILAALAYGVYVGITRDGSPPEAPDDLAAQWDEPPQVTLGAPPMSPGAAASAAPPYTPPDAATDAAPRFDAAAPAFNTDAGAPQDAPLVNAPPVDAPPLPGDSVAPRHDHAAPAPRYSDAAAPTFPSEETLLPAAGQANDEFNEAMRGVQAQLEAGQLAEAHQALSEWFGDERLTERQHAELLDLLNRVAGTVVYSRQHLLEQPYMVRAGETLENIAEQFDVPWQLLAKINGLGGPTDVTPGQELKVVRGPFNALVDLDEQLLTLVVDGRYAGQFAIAVGQDHPDPEGNFVVRAKVENPPYYGADRVINGGGPDNPFGDRLLDLGERITIHGTTDPSGLDGADPRGCIRLDGRDIQDVYDILSVGSKVIVRR